MELTQQTVEPESQCLVTPADEAMVVVDSGSTVAVPEAVELVAAGMSNHRRLYRLMAVVPPIVVLLVIALIFFVRAALGTDVFLHWIVQPGSLLSVLGTLAIAPAAISVGIRNGARRLETLSNQLTDSNDVALAGSLIDLLAVDNTIVRRNAARAITQLLPRLSAADAEALTAAQRERLVRRVCMNPDFFLYKDVNKLFVSPELDRNTNIEAIDFRIAVLRSYAEIGGELEIAAVRRIANSTSMNAAQQRLREAAQESLSAIEARLKEQARNSVLLRAAIVPQDSTNLLLPVETSASPAENLLRPSDS